MVYEIWKGGEMDDIQNTVVLSKNNLGKNNKGSLGPENQGQLAILDRLADPDFLLEPNGIWVCMDDRGRKNGIRLPGGLLWTEVADRLMDPRWRIRPLSKEVPETTKRLGAQGEIYDHGDDQAHEAGCAAKTYARAVLEYGGENFLVVGPLAWTALERLSLDDALDPKRVYDYARKGQERARKDIIWDIDPKGAASLIKKNGGKYHEFDGAHRTLGVRTNFSSYIFDNARLIDQYGIGILDIDFGPYKDHLESLGYSREKIAQKVCRAAIFGYSASKILLREDAPEVAIGTPNP